MPASMSYSNSHISLLAHHGKQRRRRRRRQPKKYHCISNEEPVTLEPIMPRSYSCRVCFEDELLREQVIAPCACAGSIQWICHGCLHAQRSGDQPGCSKMCPCCRSDYRLPGVSVADRVQLLRKSVGMIARHFLRKFTVNRVMILVLVCAFWLYLNIYVKSETNNPWRESNVYVSHLSDGSLHVWQEGDHNCRWLGNLCNQRSGTINSRKKDRCWHSGAKSLYFCCDQVGFQGRLAVQVEMLVSDGTTGPSPSMTHSFSMSSLRREFGMLLWVHFHAHLWNVVVVTAAGLISIISPDINGFVQFTIGACVSPIAACGVFCLFYIGVLVQVYRVLYLELMCHLKPLDLETQWMSCVLS